MSESKPNFFFLFAEKFNVTANQKIQAFQLFSFLTAMRQGNTQVEILFKSNQNGILVIILPSPEPRCDKSTLYSKSKLNKFVIRFHKMSNYHLKIIF